MTGSGYILYLKKCELLAINYRYEWSCLVTPSTISNTFFSKTKNKKLTKSQLFFSFLVMLEISG